MSNLFRYVSLRHLKLKPFRTTLTTVGVALGVALYIAVEILNRSTLATFKQNMESVSGRANLVVSTTGESGFPEALLDEIGKVPGVKHAVPLLESRGYLAGQRGSTETVMVFGVDLLKEQAVRTYKTTDQQAIEDPLVFLNQPDSIMVTHQFAQKHGLKTDSTFSLSTPHGIQKFTVRGMLSPEGPAKAYGGSIAIMDIDGARVTFGKVGKLDRVDVVIKENEKVDDVAARVSKKLGPGYRVERPESKSEGMDRMVETYHTMMVFFSSLALLVGLFLIGNSISISVAERKKEIGTLRALGATRIGILTVFLFEALVMGGVGSFAGAWLGRLLASAMVKMVSHSMTLQLVTKVEITQVNFQPGDILMAVMIGSIASVVAAAWPAIQTTSIQPLEAMRGREREEDPSKGSFSKFSPYIGMAMLVFGAVASWLHWVQKYDSLEKVNRILLMLGAALVGPSLVLILIKIFRPIAIPLGGTITRLAQDNLIRNPKRTGSNIISLMVGLTLVILISTINLSFRTSVSSWFDRTLVSDLIVSSNGHLSTYQMQPLDEKLSDELYQVPGVAKNTVSRTNALRFLHIPYEGQQVVLKAYDEPPPSYNYSTLNVIDRPSGEVGRELYHSQEPVILVSDNFSRRFKKTTGDFLGVQTPSGLIQFKVIGVFEEFGSSVGVLYLSRELYRKVWHDNLVSAFGIDIEKGFKVEQVREEIDRRFGQSKNLIVTANSELKQQIMESLDGSFRDIQAIEAAALLVGMLGLLNTLLISVMERMREIGMLRAVGMSRGQLSKMILQEALFQGGFGAVTATILGSWVAYVWITNSLSHVLGWIIHFSYPWASVVTTVVIGLVVALVASFIPARRASNVEITEALHYD